MKNCKMRLYTLLGLLAILTGCVHSGGHVSEHLMFAEEPTDTYLTENTSAILKCRIENARGGLFKCNNQWSQEPVTTNHVQIGNKQLLLIEHGITRVQLSEFESKNPGERFWCTCHGWMDSAEDTIISRKAYVKLAYIDEYFEWEPMTTSGLLGKSAEIRCLAPIGDPKPTITWLKNLTPIQKSNTRISVSHEGSLLINQVHTSDAANYTCVAENLAGKRRSDVAALTVTENKGWTEWSKWSVCKPTHEKDNCGEGVKKRVRSCLNPPTINNALGCQGFPEQQITCYMPCMNEGAKNVNSLVKLLKMKSEVSVLEEYGWAEWSPWSIICNSDCKRSRRRECYANDLKKCVGKSSQIDDCPYYCEPQKIIPTLHPERSSDNFNAYNHLIPPAIFLTVFMISVVLLSVALNRQFCGLKKEKSKKDSINEPENQHQPIYYSIQPDYSNQDHYMDLCTTLLPHNVHCSHQPNYPHNSSNYVLSKPLNSNCLFEPNRHENSLTASNLSGSNSTTSSKVKLNSSPTDSLAKNINCHESGCVKNCCDSTLNFNENYESSTYQILKLIDENKSRVRPSKVTQTCVVPKQEASSFDLYTFSVFRSGGLIEIPKYAINILVPDEVFPGEIQAGVFKSIDQHLLNLPKSSTILSPIVIIKTGGSKSFTKPIIVGVDHAAKFVDTEWETSVYYKSPNQSVFDQIDEKTSDKLYTHLEPNRSYILTSFDGMYVLVGHPKPSSVNKKPMTCVKEMRYSILIKDGNLKIFLAPNTRSSTEAIIEHIQSSNGTIIKMPEIFELSYPIKGSIEASYLSLEANVAYNNNVNSSDLTCRKLKMCDIWNSGKDYMQVDIPIMDRGCKLMASGDISLNVSLQLENKLVFAYSSLNAINAIVLGQQECYSSVSVNPVFIPLKITNLLDEYVSRCFKMSTLKKNDWSLFSNLIKCDRNAQLFAEKENSFELVISLWLMINLNKMHNEELIAKVYST